MHEVADQVQEADIRSRNLLERIKTKFAERNDCPQERESKIGKTESRKEQPETKKNKESFGDTQGSGKKFKTDGKAQSDLQPTAVTRKRLREELEHRIDDLRIQQATINRDESKHKGTRRRKTDREGENPDEATFEADPQLPGRPDGTKKIMERLKNRSKGIRDINSKKTCKDIHMHERDAIARLLIGGGTSSSTDRRNASRACGVGKLVSAIA